MDAIDNLRKSEIFLYVERDNFGLQNKYGEKKVPTRALWPNYLPKKLFGELSEDYYGIMADECKFTIAERFLKIRPQIEKIRATVKEMIPLKGSAK
ncbi:hypothetical protein HAX54_048792, partial [Datura stramonium]|nr:hypothetical protein [Datura stramonium]